MSDRLNISYCSSGIAEALLRAMKSKPPVVTRIDIDCVRAAVIGYLAAGPHRLSPYDTQVLIDVTLRRVVEKVG